LPRCAQSRKTPAVKITPAPIPFLSFYKANSQVRNYENTCNHLLLVIDFNCFLISLLYFLDMLAKKTSKNQITLPKAIISHFPNTEYFDVREEDGHIVLVPLRPSRAEEVRDKLAKLGLTEADVADAVQWARQS
jgi:bifunctional DNA-binding transcriptional regulator/antitoxin component of YhaV-PrlF toxin-antitoxin module